MAGNEDVMKKIGQGRGRRSISKSLWRGLWYTGVFSLWCLLSACADRSILDDLDQKQANEIVAFLQEQGISSSVEKGTGAKSKFSVLVSGDHYGLAVSLVSRFGYPRVPEKNFEDLIAQRGILPDSRDVQALRVDRALGVQTEEMLAALPGVTDVRAIVRQNYQTKGQQGDPAVSVVLTFDTSTRVPPNREEVLNLILGVLPGITPEAIRIHIQSASDVTTNSRGQIGASAAFGREGVRRKGAELVKVPLTKFLFGKHVPASEYRSFVVLFASFLLLIGALGALVGYWYGFFQRSSDIRYGASRKESLRDQLPDLGTTGSYRNDQLRLGDGSSRSIGDASSRGSSMGDGPPGGSGPLGDGSPRDSGEEGSRE